jgi:exopolysaccharide biosynthesis polyprenyl glycosylphosphotransferase
MHSHPPDVTVQEQILRKRNLRLPRISLHISERRLLLASLDLLLINSALLVTLILQGRLTLSPLALWTNGGWFLLLGLLWFAISTIFDLYNLRRAADAFRSPWASSGAVLITCLLYLLIPYASPGLPERRLEILIFVGGAITGVGLWRLLYASLLAQPHFHQTALVVGAGKAGEMLARVVMQEEGQRSSTLNGSGYSILGFVDDDSTKRGQEVMGLPILGTSQDLPHLARTLRPNEVILAITHIEQIHPVLFQLLLDCREQGISIPPMSVVYERLTGRVATEHAGNNLQVVLPAGISDSQRLYQLLLRGVDILAGLIGCLLVGLVIPAIWLANRLASPGPLFYWQERVGKHGRPFSIVKFRSMLDDAEKLSGAIWAREDDPRITPVGRMLRKTRLDEIPQFWNVLKGEMSLIGPRPERPQFVEDLEKCIRFYRLRHAVKPGITGWAQVKYHYGASVDDARTKLEYDLYYIKHQGPFLDMQILLLTIQVVLGVKGR